jgi:hypothetical protein
LLFSISIIFCEKRIHTFFLLLLYFYLTSFPFILL